MKLLFLNHNYRFNGTYYRALPMAKQLAARGHKVTLLTVSRNYRLKVTWSNENGVQLGETPNFGQNNSGEGWGVFDNAYRMWHGLAHKYDIIHMFDHKPNASFAGFTGKLRSAKLVADWADWWGGKGGINDVPKRRIPAIGTFEAWWEEKSKLWADGVITISTVLQQRAIDIGCNPERVVYIPTGAATDRIHPIPLRQARESLHLPADRIIVGFIGLGQGDLEITMHAIKQLPDVWLMIIGRKNPRVLAMAKKFGITDRFWQTDFVPDADVSTYLACANIMCLPLTDRMANWGRLPNKLLDYMAAGRPTIANPIGDVKKIIQSYQIGILAKTSDEFASAISLFTKDESLLYSMGQRARLIAETKFNWNSLVTQLEAFYEKL